MNISRNKRSVLLVFFVAFMTVTGWSQMAENIRYIEVRGSAEMEVQPDEMMLHIGIEEYWKEEFEKKKEPEDYKTKVPLAEIEDGLIKSLRKAGIEKDDIRVRGFGNFWRQRGKEFLFSKQLEVKINDFSKVNQLASLLDAKGIKYMNVGQMSHSDIEKFRKQVKADAMKDARDKAAYLVESLGETLGELISVTELNDGFVRPYPAQNRMMAADASFESVDQVQNITISYQVTARFRIE
jgi:uncharacterized protein